MRIRKNTRLFALIMALFLLLSSCGGTATTPSPPAEPTPVDLRILWTGNTVLPDQCFGDISDHGDDTIEIMVDGEVVTDFEVISTEPETMSAERTNDGKVCLTRLKSFEGRKIKLIIVYDGIDYIFACNDNSMPMYGGIPENPDALLIRYPEEYAKFTQRQYTDEELQAFVDARLPFDEACDKLSTISDVVQYLYLRDYRFMPETLGTDPEYRYYSNGGACVGGSGLLNTLLKDDYDEQGYVYIFYARGEHVMPYFVLDGVYFFCDLVTIFNNGNTDITKNVVTYMTKGPQTFYKKWLELEPHDLNDSESDMYLAIMFTTAYDGNPAQSKVMLKDSADGKYSNIPLSPREKESLNILFLRDGYTFEF